MDFDVSDLLENLFGGTVPTAAAVAQPVAQPEPIPQPEVTELPLLPERAGPVVDTLAAEWENVADFDSLPLPGDPCPVCGSLEEWTDLLERRRCGVCERETLDKALQLAERVARLRKQAQPRQSAPKIRPVAFLAA